MTSISDINSNFTFRPSNYAPYAASYFGVFALGATCAHYFEKFQMQNSVPFSLVSKKISHYGQIAGLLSPVVALGLGCATRQIVLTSYVGFFTLGVRVRSRFYSTNILPSAQKATQKNDVYFTIAKNRQLYLSDSTSKDLIPNLKNVYKSHLPSQIFDYIFKNDLVGLTSNETATEKQNLEDLDCFIIRIENYKGEKCVTIAFNPGNINAKNNFSGLHLSYQNGNIIAYAFFDAGGRDYVSPIPFSAEEEKKAENLVLFLIRGS
ncbi:MAG: hypothetical protein AAF443_03475 [Chlamydiota bacterium]